MRHTKSHAVSYIQNFCLWFQDRPKHTDTIYKNFVFFVCVPPSNTPPVDFMWALFPPAPIEKYLENLFITPDQFVILTAPEAQYKVRYVQACTHDEGIEVELGIEEEGTCLYYKMCSQEECRRIFLDFF